MPANALPDMSASLKAKVAASFEEQNDPVKMKQVYNRMGEKFLEDGLDIEAIRAHSKYFYNTAKDSPGPALPLAYADFPTPLPLGAVRLAVLYPQDLAFTTPIHQAATAIAAALPAGCKFYMNTAEHYHVTVFMTSQPHDIRADPYAGGPWDGVGAVPVPSEEVIEQEFNDMEALASNFERPILQVYRLVLTNTGTLLLCCVDTSGIIAPLRQGMRATFPGAAAKQSTILHMSLLRILTPERLTAQETTRVTDELDKWSKKLQGAIFEPHYLWHVHERKFTTVEGPRRKFPFKT